MAEYPALPLWTDAYLADTLDLSAADHGLYLIMLMLAWRRPDCALPNDMDWLKRSLQACAVGLHGHTFNSSVPKLLERFWVLEPDGQKVGKWVQKRLQKELKYLANRSEKQRKRAQERWANKDLPDATASGRGNAPTPTPIDSSLRSESFPPPHSQEFVGGRGADAPLAPQKANGSAVVGNGLPDAKAALWAEMKSHVGGANPGSLIGRWIKEYGSAEVFNAHFDAMKENPADYTDWMCGALVASGRRASKGPELTLENVLKYMDEKYGHDDEGEDESEDSQEPHGADQSGLPH